jgi:hypothetical protein
MEERHKPNPESVKRAGVPAALASSQTQMKNSIGRIRGNTDGPHQGFA